MSFLSDAIAYLTRRRSATVQQLERSGLTQAQRDHRIAAPVRVTDIARSYSTQTQPNMGAINAATLNAIVHQHNNGVFTVSGRVAELMADDERISSDLGIRTSLMTDVWNEDNVAVDLRNAEPESLLAQAWWKQNLFDIVDETCVDGSQSDKFFMGLGVQQVNWVENWWEVGPRLTRWHPSLVQYYWGDRCLAVTTQDQGLEYIEPNCKWQVFSKSNKWNRFENVWKNAGVARLGALWMTKRFAMRDWARYAETYGNLVKLLYMPADALSGVEKDTYVEALRDLSTESVLPLLVDETGKPMWDVKILQTPTAATDLHKDLATWCNQCIDVAIIGADGIISGQKGPYGSVQSLLTSVVGANPRQELRFFVRDVNELVENVTGAVFGSKRWAPVIRLKLVAENRVTEGKQDTYGLLNDGETEDGEAKKKERRSSDGEILT